MTPSNTGTPEHPGADSPSVCALAAEVRVLAQALFNPTSVGAMTLWLTLDPAAGDAVRYHAAILVDRLVPPIEGKGATPGDAVRSLRQAVQAYAARPPGRGAEPPSPRFPR